MTSTYNIKRKLLVYPYKELLCIVNRILIINNNP